MCLPGCLFNDDDGGDDDDDNSWKAEFFTSNPATTSLLFSIQSSKEAEGEMK